MALAYNILDAMLLALIINAPIQVIITIGQWLLMGRIIAPEDKTIADALRCLALTYITAYFLSLLIWLFWPLDPELILYNNRISVPAILGEALAIPFWLKRCGYIGQKRTTSLE